MPPPRAQWGGSGGRTARGWTKRRRQRPGGRRRRSWLPQSVLSRSAAIEERFVSPTERPVSFAPLNAISVDCVRTPKDFTASWLSKSSTKYTRSLNFGADISSPKIGSCALQDGHHVAWTPTKIGLPAFWASAKAFGSKGFVSVAQDGSANATLATIAAKTRL